MTSERLFRLLLHAYPAHFRERYAAEMTEYFLVRLDRARTRRVPFAMMRFWMRTITDIAATARAERASETPQDYHSEGDPAMTSFLLDLRYAARRLRRTPLFTICAVLMLALGIGLNAAVFNLVDTLAFRPPPFENPDAIVHIYQDSDEGEPNSTSYPAYRDIARETGIFSAVAASSDASASWENADVPTPVAIEYVTASYFPVLGLRPSRGRWLSPEHDNVGEEMVAVVSHRSWRTRMGSDPGVIGRTIRINGHPVTVIGVGPESFNGEAGALLVDFWLSISATPTGGPYRVTNLERDQDHWYQVQARLASGVSVERAQEAMNVLALRHAEERPEINRGRDITVFALDDVRFHPEADGTIRLAATILLVIAGLVLLLACTNLANLLLVRGIARAPEMAVRVALGAGRSRIARLLLLEAIVLSVLGGAAGLVVGAWATRLIPLLPLPIPGGGLDSGFDARMVVFGVVLTLVTGVLFGLLPALRSARPDVAMVLRDEGPGRSAGRGTSVLRGALVTVQVALSVVLVVGAGLLARSFVNSRTVNVGVDAERIAMLATNLQQGGVTSEETAAVVAQLLERVEGLPGVERAAITTRLPVQNGGSTTQVVEGYEPAAGTGSVEIDFADVSRGYFETMGIRLIAGRLFGVQDTPDAPRAIVVSETAARTFWGSTERAIGGRIRPQGAVNSWREVVGVVSDVRVQSIQEPPTPMMYFSSEQWPASSFALVARTEGDPSALANSLRSVVREVRPALPVTRLGTMEGHLSDALAGLRTAAAMMGGFSLLAILLASLGVYAVVSFSVERRSQEIGIRAALGATRTRIVKMVVGESLVVVGVGLVVGFGLAVLVTQGLRGMLYGVGAIDVPTFGGAAVILLIAAGAAAMVPAMRGARANPVDVLRGH